MAAEDIIKILISLVVGGFIGIEREYRTKPAGFRTLILISVGSTLFTLMSIKLGGPNNADRIASYILVGIGFIGSGVIFKEGLRVTGLTTAATIWITAALGITIGYGDYLLAFFVLLTVYVVLELFTRLEKVLDSLNAAKIFIISFRTDDLLIQTLEGEIKKICPKVRRTSIKREEDKLTIIYRIAGGSKKFKELTSFLVTSKDVIAFESQ